jgi:acetyl-CoA acetyltransferase
MGLQGVPIVNVENACAGGSTGLNQAYAGLLAGLYDVVLVVGADKMYFPDKKELMFSAFLGGTDVHELASTKERLANLAADMMPAAAPSTDRSFFMDFYAGIARLHMKQYGTTVRQIAAAASKNHEHSARNPLAQYRKPMSIDEVLSDQPVVWPLTRAMCAPLSDGAAAAVLCSERALGRFDRRRAVRVRASVLVSGTDREPGDFDRHTGLLAAQRAYAKAEIDPADIDVVELHDATSFAEILQVENLGLCARGDGGASMERGRFTYGGDVVVNPSGGLVSKGHPIGATGLSMIHELVCQLRGEAGPRQVVNARIGVSENGGGVIGVEEAATAITILEAPSRG